jgi:membrane-bound lytic murein transglycosylase D
VTTRPKYGRLIAFALILSGCVTGRPTAPQPQQAIVLPDTTAFRTPSPDMPIYLFVRRAIALHNVKSNRVITTLDSAALLLSARFKQQQDPGNTTTTRLVSLTRATLELYHAELPHPTPLSAQSSLAILLNTFPPKVAAELANHPHYRDFYVRKLAGEADVPIDLTPEVMAYIRFFRTDGHSFFTRWLSRGSAYLPMIQAEFQKAGLPKDLAYKAMIESGFNPRARSHANAVGMWQFMQHTGAQYHLQYNTWADERMDPEKATPAAVRHLADLYKHFKDWRLVIAAYNCGQGRLDRAIRKAGTRNFWDIDVLPRETRNHLPKFMASVIISKDPAYFGFDDVALQPPISYDTVALTEPVGLRLAAKCVGTTYDWIQQLNPELRRAYTPPSSTNKPYLLRVPKGTAEKFKTNYARVPDSDKIQMVDYTIKPGDTISGIANRLGVRAQVILDANGIQNPRHIRSGRKLKIPIQPQRQTQVAQWKKGGINRLPDLKNYAKTQYTIKKGDTLWDIAKAEGLTPQHLQAWNAFTSDRAIHPGDKLDIYLPKSGLASNTHYTVRNGDTLWDIARTFQTSVKELKTWNNIHNPSGLRPGTRLRIRPESEQSIAE